MSRNLLHICNDLPYWIAHRRPLAEAARDAGWRVTLATAPHAAVAGLAADGFSHIALPVDRFRFNPLADARLFGSLLPSMTQARFDAVHLFTIKPLLIGGLAARLAPTLMRRRQSRIIGTVAGIGRGLDGSTSGWQVGALHRGLAAGLGRCASAVTFENSGDRDFYVRNALVDAGHTHVLPGAGIDLATFRPAALTRDPDVVTVLFAGRLLRSKGVVDLMDAASILKARFGDRLRVHIAGAHTDNDPDGLSAAERQRLESDGEVRYLGARDVSEMPALMASADVFVLPTRYPEGLPRVLLEAGATGAALVAGDVDGTRAFIEHEANGLLLQNTSGVAIADAVTRLAEDPGLRRRLGEAARDKLERGGYDIRDIAAQFLRLYDGLQPSAAPITAPSVRQSSGKVVLPGSNGLPYPTLASIIAHFGAESPAPAEISMFGDSVAERVSRRDNDSRTLAQMVSEAVAPQTLLALTRSAHQPAIYEPLLRAMLLQPQRPRVLILPVNLRCFSPQWMLNPDWQFAQERNILAGYLAAPRSPFAAIDDVLHDAQAHRSFDATDVNYELSAARTIGDFKALIATKPVEDEQRLRRAREIFVYHYTHQLRPDNERLLALRSCLKLASDLVDRVVLYTTPINHEAGARCVGSRFNEIIHANVAVLKSTAGENGIELLDWSELFPESAFFHEDLATEHLNEVGRRELATRIAAAC